MSRNDRRWLVGVSGGIGAGKSVVSRMLRCRGFRVYDCDLEARRLMEGSAGLKREIAERFGADCLNADNTLHRANIARCVFADKSQLEWLNGRVHRMVREDVERAADEAGGEVLFVESAILHTSGLDRMCREVWQVEAPEELRLQRACGRDGADPEQIAARMKAQREEMEATGCCRKRTILNDGVHPLLGQIDRLLEELLQAGECR